MALVAKTTDHRVFILKTFHKCQRVVQVQRNNWEHLMFVLSFQ